MTTARRAAGKPLRIALRALFGPWFRLRVEGRQHLRTAAHVIQLARLASPLDALLPAALLPRPAAVATTGPRTGTPIGGRRP